MSMMMIQRRHGWCHFRFYSRDLSWYLYLLSELVILISFVSRLQRFSFLVVSASWSSSPNVKPQSWETLLQIDFKCRLFKVSPILRLFKQTRFTAQYHAEFKIFCTLMKILGPKLANFYKEMYARGQAVYLKRKKNCWCCVTSWKRCIWVRLSSRSDVAVTLSVRVTLSRVSFFSSS